MFGFISFRFVYLIELYYNTIYQQEQNTMSSNDIMNYFDTKQKANYQP